MQKVPEAESAQAIVHDGVLMIRVAVDTLPIALRGAYSIGALDERFKVTDTTKFAQEVANALNEEDEQGTTAVHRMFDAAFQACAENGAEGMEEDPEGSEDDGDE